MHTKSCFLIGAGGHAKVVLDAMQQMNILDIDVWDDALHLDGKALLNMCIKTPVQFERLVSTGHVAIGNNRVRREISEKLNKLEKTTLVVIHPTASIAEDASIHDGCFIAAHAVIAPDSILNEGVIVNHGAVVDHDCNVGCFSHIAPNATLGGNVVIGNECLIGACAVVLPGIHIANGVTVGAGAVVTSSIDDENVVVYGVVSR